MRKLATTTALLFAALMLIGPVAKAGELLVNQENPYLGYGYGLSSWGTFTADLNGAFGASNITVSSSPLDNLAYLMSFNALLLTARQPGGAEVLSAAEITNIEAFIASGNRVLLTGENGAWSAWNNSILATVGGAYSGSDTSDILSPVMVSQLTAGVLSLNTIADGIANGGTPLFSENVVTLWGGSQNALTLLSMNVEQDSLGNTQFDSNTAAWLAGGASPTPTPEPCTLLLMGSFLGLVGFIRRRRI
jgi:hypothetical protein